jgi:hypothetical protein
MITDHILYQLANGDMQTLPELLTAVPELAAEPNGVEVLRLLLRLDRRVRLLPDGRWTLTAAAPTPETRIVTSAQTFLDRIPTGGAMLSSLVDHVVKETNYDPARVRAVIMNRFVNNGKLVRNKLKETQ